MNQPDPALRAQHDAMLGRLSARASTTHFAHSAVSIVTAVIFGGVAGKLLWDFGDRHLEWTSLVGAIAVLMLTYSIVRFLLGRRALKGELTDFEKLKEMRVTLRLDEPAAWLPGDAGHS